MKVNIKSLISYIILLALFIFLFWFNRRRVILFFVVALLIFPVFSFVLLKKSFRLPACRLFPEESSQIEGEKNKIFFEMKYDGFFPFSKIDVRYSIKHRNEEKKVSVEDSYSIFHGTRTNSLGITLEYCGIYEVETEYIIFNDFLGILGRKHTLNPKTDICVMPKTVEFPESIIARTLDDDNDYETDPTAGEDVSEIREFREYRDGDRLSQIHWKLSTKSEDLIVKEYEKQAGVCVAIGCDGSFNNLLHGTHYYEILYSLGRKLLQEEIFFEISYISSLTDEPVTSLVNNTYDLCLVIQNMFYYMKQSSIEELEEYINLRMGKNKLFFITTLDADSEKNTIYQYEGVRVIA